MPSTKYGRNGRKRWLVGLSVVVNLGMLGYFKYTNFLIEIANHMFGQGFLKFQNIFLPVGISFFVFQSMSYTIDIYRGNSNPSTTGATTCSISRSSHNWWPGRSSAQGTSSRKSGKPHRRDARNVRHGRIPDPHRVCSRRRSFRTISRSTSSIASSTSRCSTRGSNV